MKYIRNWEELSKIPNKGQYNLNGLKDDKIEDKKEEQYEFTRCF